MTKAIALTRGMVTLVDDEDYDWLLKWSWCALNSGYAVRGESRDGCNHMILMHRVILERAGIEIPDANYVDHINHNRLDNRKDNLRLATPQQSAYNMPQSNINGYRGVLFVPVSKGKNGKIYTRKRQWQARIRIPDHSQRSLGYFVTVEEAARAYDDAARKYHGEFATLNFPGDTNE